MTTSVSSLLFIVSALLGMVVLFFLIYALCRRFIGSKRMAVTVSGLLAPLVLLGGILLANFSQQTGQTSQFDKEQWYKGDKERRQVCDIILSTGILMGKTPQEIEQFLGSPDVKTDSVVYYKLDMKKPVEIADKLTVVFADGVVAETRLE